jgi:hypothetical protein
MGEKEQTFQKDELTSHGVMLLQVPGYCIFSLPGTQYRAEIHKEF